MCGSPQCDWPEWRKTVEDIVKRLTRLEGQVTSMDRRWWILIAVIVATGIGSPVVAPWLIKVLSG